MKPVFAIFGGLALIMLLFLRAQLIMVAPETVKIAAGAYTYQLAGQFKLNGDVVDGPVEFREAHADFEIMKYLVSEAEYGACVADRACRASHGNSPILAQVDISYIDAIAYVAWLSKRTGQKWRLPTDEEWMRAAGDRFVEAAIIDIQMDIAKPNRWLAESLLPPAQVSTDSARRPLGGYGENELGVADISGNIWEWTESCFQIGILDMVGGVKELDEYCNVRAAQGRHRAFIIDFVRDAKIGGCAVGAPPDYLGFRLVRDL